MFGKRSGTVENRPASPHSLAGASTDTAAAATIVKTALPAGQTDGRVGLVSASSQDSRAPVVSVAQVSVTRPEEVSTNAVSPKRSEAYYERKTDIFGALLEAIDLSQLARLDADTAREEIRDILTEILTIKKAAMSISASSSLRTPIRNGSP